jgi:hypothetical protein
MIKAQTLYINLDAQPQTALVYSTSNLQPKSMGSIVAGDTLRYIIYAIDATGATSSYSGNTAIRCNVGIGGLGDGALVYSTTPFVSSGSAWTGSINANTGSLLTQMGTSDTFNAYLEVELVVTGSSASDSGSRYTILQAPITVRNQVIA